MTLVDDKWDTDDYNYCKKHDMYYKKYCGHCALDMPEVEQSPGDNKHEC